MKIFLIGFMGSGKTYWGSRWAAKYELQFIDLDDLVEKRENKTIAQLFEQKGEEYFRQVESECLKNFHKVRSCIMSCGGGAPCFNNNMQWMNENGTTIYLSAAPEFLYSRLLEEKDKRPLLKNLAEPELLSFIEQKLKEREPFYKQAKFILPSEDLNMESLQPLNL
ncbi:MAG: shikimate kinase [Chitinophagaceae bacterium]|nr:shikimate kinase [Chitinophagaceae bacterium]